MSTPIDVLSILDSLPSGLLGNPSFVGKSVCCNKLQYLLEREGIVNVISLALELGFGDTLVPVLGPNEARLV